MMNRSPKNGQPYNKHAYYDLIKSKDIKYDLGKSKVLADIKFKIALHFILLCNIRTPFNGYQC